MSDDPPRVLVVEDHVLVELQMVALVEEGGCSVVGPVCSVGDGLAAVRENHLDGAVLDINLGDECVWPVAELLEQRGVPFIFVTAYTMEQVPEHFRNRPLLSKPFRLDALSKALTSMCTVRA